MIGINHPNININDGSIPEVKALGDITLIRIIWWTNVRSFLDPLSHFYSDAYSRKLWDTELVL